MRKWLLMLCCLLLIASVAGAEGLQDCHRFTLVKEDVTQENQSVVRLWHIDTSNDGVDEKLNAIAQAYVDRIAPTLAEARNATSLNSRLDVPIRASRTGLSWMSFLVQARTTYHRKLIAQEFTSRTYDMRTGARILLTDIFPQDSGGWEILRRAVTEAVRAHFPGEEPDAAALEQFTSDAGLRAMDFTLHGFSLVLHLPAWRLYPGRNTLIEVTLMYPEIRPYMTGVARMQTDNLVYYRTVALTFDDGPDRTNTTKVLNSLLECGERGTFFVVGNRISEYADLVQRENDEGHAIGAHNWSHASVTSQSVDTLQAMVGKFDEQLIAAIGIPTRYDRVPYGLYPQMISAQVGWPLIQWSVDTYDWRGRSVTAIMNNIRGQFTQGDIVLMHDIKDNTPLLATTLVNWLKEEGYMLLTVDELFATDGVTLAADTVYFRCENGVTTLKHRE